ncbi:MAG: MutS-related protein [Longimicrobiales bacterium]
MTGPRETYESRRARYAAELDRERVRSRRLSQLRLAAFLVMIGAGVWAELWPATIPLVLAAAALVAFVALIIVHARVRRRQEWTASLEALNAVGMNRLARNWSALPRFRPEPSIRTTNATIDAAADLDVFGQPALGQLLGPANTPAGRATLGSWLLSAPRPAVIRERQSAIRELAPQIDLRDTLAAHGRRAGEVGAEQLRPFIEWAEEPPLMTAHPLWLWLARLIPVATLATIVLDIAGVGPPRLWLPCLLAAAALSFGPGRTIHATFKRAFSRVDMFHGYPEVLGVIAAARLRSPLLARLQTEMSADGVSAARQMARLGRLMHLADLRYSGMLYVPVQLLLLWDFHVMARIDAWRRVAGAHVRRWFQAIGEVEALSALATLQHDHPEWPFPELTDGDDAVLDAQRLGHPMLPPETRIDNDVRVGPPGTFLLVTGSNMSGKSTLLRAIGLNVVLAHAGAPVCAQRMRLPPVALRTSIHIEDSLVRGVSFFMAQLERMKEIVTAADGAAADDDGVRILYLLDEILQGTNTAERRIAATRVIRHLVDRGAIGAVTTHDLELASEAALAGAAVPVHFRETVRTGEDGPMMSFDYTLRPGVATSTNALKLMEIVGLD